MSQGDAGVVLAALVHAVEPLTADELATALGWTRGRAAAAGDHVEHHPEIAGPVAVRRTEPGTFTTAARMDRLTTGQRHALGQAQLYRHPLTTEQADMLLAVLVLRSSPQDYLAYRDTHLQAEHGLERHGLVHTEHGPHQPTAHPDLLYNLRYWNTPPSWCPITQPLTEIQRDHRHRSCASTDIESALNNTKFDLSGGYQAGATTP